MTEHLPECFASLCECDDTHFKSTDCDFSCICPSLRACEKRVRVNERDWRDQSFGLGYAAGVQAARDAVAAVGVRKDTSHDMRVQALAAIDALREEKP